MFRLPCASSADRDSDFNNMCNLRISGGDAEGARKYIEEFLDSCGSGMRTATATAGRQDPEPFVQIDWQNIAEQCVSGGLPYCSHLSKIFETKYNSYSS